MNSSIEELKDRVFKRIEGTPSPQDLQTFNVFQAIDGKRSVGTIARQEHYELSQLAAVIEQLSKAGAIEPIDSDTDTSKTVGADLIKKMDARLSLIMGRSAA